MKIFLTGATGFLGKRLMVRLLDEGHEVTALVRTRNAVNWAGSLGAEAVLGNFRYLEDWSPVLEGQEVVIHCAAPVKFWGTVRGFERGITEASVSLYRASAQAGVRRFIHISSDAVMQGSKPLLDVNEQYECPPYSMSVYGSAKRKAELALLAEPQGPELIILRPSFIWGTGMKLLTPVVEKIEAGQFAWIDGGRRPMEMVHVDNLVEALVLSLRAGQHQDIFLITDDHPTAVRDFLSQLLEAKGVALPHRNLPNWLVKPMAFFLDWFWRKIDVMEVPPPLTRFEWAFVAQARRYDISKAKQVLGYKPVVSREEGLAAMRAEATQGEA